MGAGVIAALIILSLVLYFVGDRLTPYTSQARVQAFVAPVAAEVSGKVTKVDIRNDDVVEAGQLLSVLIGSIRNRASVHGPDYESVGQSVNAATAGVEAARASLQTAQTELFDGAKDASRQERLHEEDPGAISVRRLEIAQSRATKRAARSPVPRPICARPRKGPAKAASNAQLRSARSAVEKRSST
jgi:multidrug resistance efflux pump